MNDMVPRRLSFALLFGGLRRNALKSARSARFPDELAAWRIRTRLTSAATFAPDPGIHSHTDFNFAICPLMWHKRQPSQGPPDME